MKAGDQPEMSEKRTDIVLFVEHVVRELDVACAVKYLADGRHGLAVEIASIAMHLPRTLERHQPRVVVVPYCYAASNFGLRDILPVWPGAVYVNLAYEQIFRKHQQATKEPSDAFARRHVLHHAWGDFYAEYLQEHGVLGENIFVNGNLSYALYRAPYCAYFDSRDILAKRFRLDPNKHWVLVPENYGAAFYSDAIVQGFIRRGHNEAEDFRDFALASLREAVQWWSRAAEQGGVELIVRPRPATPKASFMKICKDVVGPFPRHLHIIKDGTVREWILASDVVASSYSTTLIEASIAGKPICMFAPIPFPDFLHAEWYHLAPRAESLSEFLEMVISPTSATNSQPLRAWAERTMMKHGDPISNLVDYLAAVYRGETPVPDQPSNSDLAIPAPQQAPRASRGSKWPRWVRRIWAWMRMVMGRQRVSAHEQDEFDDHDVAQRVSKWAQVLGEGLEERSHGGVSDA